MRRPPVSIVIPVWNLASTTAACLEALLTTVEPDDQIIVVDNGSRDQTPQVLARYQGRIEVVTHTENLGFAAGCNAGARLADRPVTVFLNNDTLPQGRWLDPLLAPFDDATVGATGPMSNFVSGSQRYQVPKNQRIRGLGDVRRLARAAMVAGAGRTWQTHRLVGFALAVRTDLFSHLGGFDTAFEIGGYEDDDLSRRIQAAGYHLLVVAGSFVYHLGHATFDANGLDWGEIEARNRDVLVEKIEAMPVLSLVVDCLTGFEASARSLIEIVDACPGQVQLVLVEHGDGVARSLAEQVSGGDVQVVDCPEEGDGVRRGLAAASGRKRVSIRSGEQVDVTTFRRFVDDSDADFSVCHVGKAFAPLV